MYLCHKVLKDLILISLVQGALVELEARERHQLQEVAFVIGAAGCLGLNLANKDEVEQQLKRRLLENDPTRSCNIFTTMRHDNQSYRLEVVQEISKPHQTAPSHTVFLHFNRCGPSDPTSMVNCSASG